MNSGDVPPYADSEIVMRPAEECSACAASQTALLQLILNHGFTTGDAETLADLIREIDARLSERKMICGACGDAWQDGMSCGQKNNGWPFQTCYPVLALSSQPWGTENER